MELGLDLKLRSWSWNWSLKPPELELEMIFWTFAGVGIGVGVETSGVAIGVGVAILQIGRSWSWSWNLCSWSWSWVDIMELTPTLIGVYLLIFFNVASLKLDRSYDWPNATTTDDIFKCIFMDEKLCILIRISLNCVPKDPITQHWFR